MHSLLIPTVSQCRYRSVEPMLCNWDTITIQKLCNDSLSDSGRLFSSSCWECTRVVRVSNSSSVHVLNLRTFSTFGSDAGSFSTWLSSPSSAECLAIACGRWRCPCTPSTTCWLLVVGWGFCSLFHRLLQTSGDLWYPLLASSDDALTWRFFHGIVFAISNRSSSSCRVYNFLTRSSSDWVQMFGFGNWFSSTWLSVFVVCGETVGLLMVKSSAGDE